MKEFRIVCNNIKSDWFKCEDFKVSTMNHLAELLKYDNYYIEYREA